MSSLKRILSTNGICVETPRKNEVISANDIDVGFIPVISKILRDVEKEQRDGLARNKQCQEIAHRAEELHKKFDLVRNQIQKLPGVELSIEDQLKNLENLKKQLRLKKELILKYRNMASQ
ncbi:mediator of RNA polymerase II transcription subunit 9-like [Belonocnema kinseyi]|uniref:mediator of RNA polymerase II transcription subunit 9-like n=1 Tax=Belonocnema kinseyi TaxID=2817044 RepID=UPI00143D9438|nr:mediator of RNA polymerase II transcription subunit 9-like [Belonocnema kinseyi]XP_033228736.1 mediator of RNA polymerase II transcription subunit 9-like [Belonocnema kinseyi]